MHQDDVFDIAERYMRDMVAKLVPHKTICVEFTRLPYDEAMEYYGSDKPDLRFDMQFVDISQLVENSEFGVFANAIKEGGIVKAVKLDGQIMTRKEIDDLTEVAKQAGAGGLAYFIYENNEVRSPIAKFFTKEQLDFIQEATDAEDGDMLFFGVGKKELVNKVLNKIRLHCRDYYKLANDNDLAFVWITDFPFYEYDEKNKTWDF